MHVILPIDIAIIQLILLVLLRQALHLPLHGLHLRRKYLRLLRLLYDHVPCSVDDFLPEDIDVPLSQLHRLDQEIVAVTDEIDVHEGVVSSDAVDPLVIVHGVSRSKFNHDPELRLGIHFSDLLAEAEDVLLVRVELEGSWVSAVVLHVEDLLLRVFDFNGAEVETCVGKNKVITLGNTLALE